MQKFIEFLIFPLVSDPAHVIIGTTTGTIVISVPVQDMGRVIGKRGQAIFHLRVLANTYAKLHHLPPKYIQVTELTA